MMIILPKLSRKEVNILKSYKYTLEGLDCAACANEIQEKLAKNQTFHKRKLNGNIMQLKRKNK